MRLMKRTAVLLTIVGLAVATGQIAESRPRRHRARAHPARVHRTHAPHLQPPGTAVAEAPGDLALLPFAGHFRARAKTTMLGEPEMPFASIAELRQTLKSDAAMRSGHPGVAATGQNRFAEENRAVTVTTRLLAVKLERGATGDNDFHCILGEPGSGKLLDAEVSGLPAGGDKQPFIDVRNQLLDLLGHPRFTNAYVKPSPPIRVQVAGSLYFDGDHDAGSIGPHGMQPTTAWEIHPIHSIRKIQ
jgi:hypothetical protein